MGHQQISEGHKVTKGRGTILCQRQQISEDHKVTTGRGTILCQRQQISEDHKVTKGRGTILCQRQQISEGHKVTTGRGTIFISRHTTGARKRNLLGRQVWETAEAISFQSLVAVKSSWQQQFQLFYQLFLHLYSQTDQTISTIFSMSTTIYVYNFTVTESGEKEI